MCCAQSTTDQQKKRKLRKGEGVEWSHSICAAATPSPAAAEPVKYKRIITSAFIQVYARRIGQPTQRATNYTARSNIEPAQIFPHANGQSAPGSGGARDFGRGAGSHTSSTASESFSMKRDRRYRVRVVGLSPG